MQHTFIHISDLHFAPDWHEEIELVCTALLSDLRDQIATLDSPYLVLSGDVVAAGESEAAYTAFVARFGDALTELGLSPERRLCVPGNHDVSRSALADQLLPQVGALRSTDTERLFNDNFLALSKAFFQATFENYLSYERAFTTLQGCTKSIGGHGIDLPGDLGVYCLNTALCSLGGLTPPISTVATDRGHLLVHTRPLHQWLNQTQSRARVLLMHHPIEWLADWASIELAETISTAFDLVLHGHNHRTDAAILARPSGSAVYCSAPPLFTSKAGTLGYAIISICSDTAPIRIQYRQWARSTRRFVAGTVLAGNETGIVDLHLPTSNLNDSLRPPAPQEQSIPATADILRHEFEEASTCYSSKRTFWIDRQLVDLPETHSDVSAACRLSLEALAETPHSCIIRAPRGFGLTCAGRFIALHSNELSRGQRTAIVLDADSAPTHKHGVKDFVLDRCEELRMSADQILAIIVDDWHNGKAGLRLLKHLSELYPEHPIVLLHPFEDFKSIADEMDLSQYRAFETWYLWALTQSQIRELATNYVSEIDSLDADAVTHKITRDLTALNIHRTPMNCLLLLKCCEHAFDDSPVNRTDIISRVLFLLFHQYDAIPRYARRPDLTDCEYALGFLCESLIRNGQSSFSKQEFLRLTRQYCDRQFLDLDCDLLFSFLVSEGILIRTQLYCAFRFNYWLYYFAAHRMHHSADFREHILSEYRYAAMPEIVEFYTGIDRRRNDAVDQLTDDLRKMNDDFLERTGIPAAFDPFTEALWSPSDESVERMKSEVSKSLSESTLPARTKDAIADERYDRREPYNQDIAQFIHESSLVQMISAMRGAARALRNSDHVIPEKKAALLDEVIRSWVCMSQVLSILSPILASYGAAAFEGCRFYLVGSLDKTKPQNAQWAQVMHAVVDNVVMWYEEDIASRRMGSLLASYVRRSSGVGQLLVVLLMIEQRPHNWQRTIERFIVESGKNSFGLCKAFEWLMGEVRYSFASEQSLQMLKQLAAMAVAKHHTGKKHPDSRLIDRAAAQLRLGAPEPSTRDGGGSRQAKKRTRRKRK